jgi:hypothetical protein
VHAYIHTVFVWVHYRALPSDWEVTLPLPNIPRRSVHACRMLCTTYHGKWHAYTDANSVATNVIVYMVWVQIHTVSKQGYSWLFLSHSVYQFKLRQRTIRFS